MTTCRNGREAYISGSLDPVVVLSAHGDRCTVRLIDGTTTSVPKAQLLQKRGPNGVRLTAQQESQAGRAIALYRGHDVDASDPRNTAAYIMRNKQHRMLPYGPAHDLAQSAEHYALGGTLQEAVTGKARKTRRKNPGKGTYASIKVGDTVTINLYHGGTKRGKVVMLGPAGWVLNLGGRYGTPGIATPENFVSVTHPKKVAPRLSWRDNPAKRVKLSLPAGVRVAETVDGTWMILVGGIQWGPPGSRPDRSGAMSDVWPSRAAAVHAYMANRSSWRDNPAKRRKTAAKRTKTAVRKLRVLRDVIDANRSAAGSHARLAKSTDLQFWSRQDHAAEARHFTHSAERLTAELPKKRKLARKKNPSGAQLVGTFKDYPMYFEGISYNCPGLSLWGYRSEGSLKAAITAKVGKITGTSKQEQVAAKMAAKGWTIDRHDRNIYAYKSGDARSAKRRYKIGPASLRAETHAPQGWVAVGNSMTLTAALKELG